MHNLYKILSSDLDFQRRTNFLVLVDGQMTLVYINFDDESLCPRILIHQS